jgi:UDP-3-O-acyl-N-acetylglucosamine deacetylase
MIETATNDVKHLLQETIVYNTAIWGIVSDDLETESFDISLLQEKKNQFNNDQHRKLYETNQEIANRLFIFLDDVEKLKDAGDTHTGNSILEQAILSCVASMKHIKNIRHNIQALSSAS